MRNASERARARAHKCDEGIDGKIKDGKSGLTALNRGEVRDIYNGCYLCYA